MDLRSVLLEIPASLTDAGIDHALMGGLALAAHGAARATVDDVRQKVDGAAKLSFSGERDPQGNLRRAPPDRGELALNPPSERIVRQLEVLKRLEGRVPRSICSARLPGVEATRN